MKNILVISTLLIFRISSAVAVKVIEIHKNDKLAESLSKSSIESNSNNLDG